MPSSTVGPADAPAASRSVAGTSLAPRARSASTETALVATFAALLAVCSLLALSFGAVPVPVTLQTFAVLLAGAVLGPRLGPLAVLLHLVVGLVGLPVLAGAKGGLAVLAGPSAGYLLAFPLAALVTGVIVVALRRRGAALVAVTLLAGSRERSSSTPSASPSWRGGRACRSRRPSRSTTSSCPSTS